MSQHLFNKYHFRKMTINSIPTVIQCMILTYLPIKSNVCTSVSNKSWLDASKCQASRLKQQDYLIKAQPDTIGKWLHRITPYVPRSLSLKFSHSSSYSPFWRMTSTTNVSVNRSIPLSQSLCESLQSLELDLLDVVQTPPHWFNNLTSLTLSQSPNFQRSSTKTAPCISNQLIYFPKLKTFNGILPTVDDWTYLPNSLTSLSLCFHSTQILNGDQFIQILNHLSSLTYIDCLVDQPSVQTYTTLLTHPCITTIGPCVWWEVEKEKLETAVDMLTLPSSLLKSNVLERMTSFESMDTTLTFIFSILPIIAPQLMTLGAQIVTHSCYHDDNDNLMSLIESMKNLKSLKLKLYCSKQLTATDTLLRFLPNLSQVLTSLTIQPYSCSVPTLYSSLPSLPLLNELFYTVSQEKDYSLRWYSRWKSYPQLRYISFRGDLLTERWLLLFEDIRIACVSSTSSLDKDDISHPESNPSISICNSLSLHDNEMNKVLDNQQVPSRLYLKLPVPQNKSDNWLSLCRYGVVHIQYPSNKSYCLSKEHHIINSANDILLDEGIYYNSSDIENSCF